jgi:predicted transcriptional regulator
MTNQNLDTIFQVLGNNSRRKIIDLLSEEPMYFNQISKEVGIGQQAMLRHMHSLDKTGFVKSFGEKSNYGAPDRQDAGKHRKDCGLSL